MLTPADLVNPKRKSGYDHVRAHPDNGRIRRYQAAGGGRRPGQASAAWWGTYRHTAKEAAQDYCDYINHGGAATPVTLKTAGHNYTTQKIEMDEEVQAALGVLKDYKAQREGKQGYVYCIREAVSGGGFSQVKIGYSTNPWKRVAELQTGNPRPLALVCMKKGTPADEKAIHAKYIRHNVLQEWFTVSKEMLLEFDLGADGMPYAKCDSIGT